MPTTEELDAELDKNVVLLQAKRDTLFEYIQIVYEKSKKAQMDDECMEDFLCSVETIDEIRSEFRSAVNAHNHALVRSNPPCMPSYQALNSFDDLYCRIKRVLKNVVPKPSQVNLDRDNSIERSGLKCRMPSLPPIEIIAFDGDIRNWPLFYAGFKSMVHDNPMLTNAERLYYLVGKLSKKAQTVFSGITPCADNYDMILKCLLDRYEDTRTLACTYLDQLLNVKLTGNDPSSKLQLFLDQFVTATSALKNLQLDNLSDFMLLHIALKKLDESTVRAFESQYRDVRIPTFVQLTEFVRGQYRIYHNLQSSTSASSSSRNNVNKPRSYAPNPQTYVAVSASHKKCLCDNFVHDHLYKCPKLNEMTPSARFKVVKEFSACINCLSLKHKARDCNSNFKCRSCQQKHHSLLHFNNTLNQSASQPQDNVLESALGFDPALTRSRTMPLSGAARAASSATPSASPAPRARSPASTPKSNVSSLHASIAPPVLNVSSEINHETQCKRSTTILLSTAEVVIYDSKGQPHLIKCLLDSGSQSNFVTNECCLHLGLNYDKDTQMIVKGFGGSEKSIKGSTCFKIYSRFSDNVYYDISALVVDRITDNLPSVPVDESAFAHIQSLPLADSTFAKPSEVQILLGADTFSHLLLPGMVKGSVKGIPPAIETVLGYIMMGSAPVLIPKHTSKSTSACCAVVEQPSLDDLLKRFWSLEEVCAPPAHSQEDLECENHFRSTTTRSASGRYTVSLPFRDDVYKLGDSYSAARKRFFCLERKLESSNTLRAAYNDIIREYIDKEYVTELGSIDNVSPAASYFVPHHCVQRDDKTTTKVRIVLDSSSKTSSGVSLNQILHAGPNLQDDLNSILLNFRLFKIAISSDVRQMFLQIGMQESDRKYQRILFRFNSQDPISVFQFNRVVFGTRSSVFHAIRVIKQLIADEKHRFPIAAAIASDSTYMDDVCFSIMSNDSSQDDNAVAIAACSQLIELFKCAQFDLVKWTSNSTAVLSGIPASHRASSDLEIDRGATPQKILGTHWDRSDDVFKFRVAAPELGCTKRIILSAVARLWDNLGLVAPVILHAKLLIQELWLLKCDWDDTPPKRIEKLWSQFCSELPALHGIRIPRHLGVVQGCVVNLLGFADASERAYGAVIYLQVAVGDSRTVSLVCSKSKVAPLKTLSIARLELCAVVLMSKLLRKVIDIFQPRYKISNVFAFTDSKIVLCWIKSSPHRWQTFVANRVVAVADNVPTTCFHHVAGIENPADCLSRGLSPATLVNHPLWFLGPPWASKDPAEWPIAEFSSDEVSDVPEQRPLAHTVTLIATESPIYKLANRISSWSKLLRIVVFVCRMLKLLPRQSVVTRSDLEFAEIKIILALQRADFEVDINKLKTGINCSPALQKLKPFLDDNGIIRVGGRLSNADLSYTQKHPCVLPRHGHVVDMIIDYYHKKHLHAGPELLMSLLRHHYWILAARRVIRHRIHKCNTCFRAKPRPSYFPMMADLPAFRVNQVVKPFIYTGCDYAGPLTYTPVRGRGVKGRKAWLCIFSCLTTRALHIEISTELSTVSFLAAFKRFLSRRGPIQCLYTDNATNFVGCSSYVRDLYKFLDEFKPHLNQELLESRIDFKRIPPASPHWGGCWESMVKVVKSHLFKAIGQQILSYEELLTVLAQVEAVINSRPLTALSSDPAEPTALTPAHFLHTAPLYSLPAPHVETNLIERHSLLNSMVLSFWQRWRVQYLHQLQARAKWTVPSTPIQLGTVVIIIVDNAPPLSWPLGVIEAVHPSKDRTTRVVTVRTSKGSFVRPVVRLCPLPNQ